MTSSALSGHHQGSPARQDEGDNADHKGHSREAKVEQVPPLIALHLQFAFRYFRSSVRVNFFERYLLSTNVQKCAARDAALYNLIQFVEFRLPFYPRLLSP